MSKDEVVVLSPEEAIARLNPNAEEYHVMMNPVAGMFIGADWSRKEIIEAFKKYEVQESGPSAAKTGHTLVFHDGTGYCFVEPDRTVQH